MLNLICSCGEKYLADEIHIGKKIICKKCRKVIEIARPINAQNNSQADIPLYTPPPKPAYSNNDNTKKQSDTNKASRVSPFKDDTKKLWPFLIILLVALIAYCNKKSSNSNTNDYSSSYNYNQPETGSLFIKDSSNTTDSTDALSSSKDNSLETPFDYSNLKPIKEFKKIEPESNNVIRKEERKEYEFWDKPNLLTGQTPCYNFVPTYDYDSKNSIEIKVGRNADVAAKLYNYYNDQCIRYVYIRRGDSYKMENLPVGKYYTKIAYGLDWRDTIVDDRCIGMFEKYDYYKKGSSVIKLYKTLEYVTNEEESYKYNSITIFLDLVFVKTGTEAYKTSNISREEFNR